MNDKEKAKAFDKMKKTLTYNKKGSIKIIEDMNLNNKQLHQAALNKVKGQFKCDECEGEGSFVATFMSCGGQPTRRMTCPKCNGSGVDEESLIVYLIHILSAIGVVPFSSSETAKRRCITETLSHLIALAEIKGVEIKRDEEIFDHVKEGFSHSSIRLIIRMTNSRAINNAINLLLNNCEGDQIPIEKHLSVYLRDERGI